MKRLSLKDKIELFMKDPKNYKLNKILIEMTLKTTENHNYDFYTLNKIIKEPNYLKEVSGLNESTPEIVLEYVVKKDIKEKYDKILETLKNHTTNAFYLRDKL